MTNGQDGSRLASQATGAFLILIGFGFLLLLVKLRKDGELSGDFGVSAFMISFGSVLILTGSAFWSPRLKRADREGRDTLDRYVLKSRPVVELLAATGGLFMVGHVVALCLGVHWPPRTAVWILILTPIATGLMTLRILMPHAFQSGLFANEILERWSALTRVFINLLLRAGWAGYFGIVLIWAELKGFLPKGWRPALEILASSLISALYASQVLVLHFGRTRDADAIGTRSHNGK